MQDPSRVFNELGLKEGDIFLDVGCGVGEYALHAAKLVGNAGHVYALDKSPDLVDGLKEQAATKGLMNITTMTADAAAALPIRDSAIDVCLVATLLHIPDMAANADRLFSEIRRVLRPSGHLTILECSKKDLSFGPPEAMRLSPDEIEAMATRCCFRKLGETDLGFNYMIKLSVAENKHARGNN